jgi:hypothetical protein
MSTSAPPPRPLRRLISAPTLRTDADTDTDTGIDTGRRHPTPATADTGHRAPGTTDTGCRAPCSAALRAAAPSRRTSLFTHGRECEADRMSDEVDAGTTTPTITDEFMQEMLGLSQPYTVVLLRAGPRYGDEAARGIIWEHGRRNFELRAAGKLAVVCPIMDDSSLAGVGVFAADVAETEALMADDPAVRAGVLVAEFHPSRSFAGDRLPEWN